MIILYVDKLHWTIYLSKLSCTTVSWDSGVHVVGKKRVKLDHFVTWEML